MRRNRPHYSLNDYSPRVYTMHDGIYLMTMAELFVAEHPGIEPLLQCSCRGFSDEAWHCWHPDDWGVAYASPWATLVAA